MPTYTGPRADPFADALEARLLSIPVARLCQMGRDEFNQHPHAVESVQLRIERGEMSWRDLRGLKRDDSIKDYLRKEAGDDPLPARKRSDGGFDLFDRKREQAEVEADAADDSEGAEIFRQMMECGPPDSYAHNRAKRERHIRSRRNRPRRVRKPCATRWRLGNVTTRAHRPVRRRPKACRAGSSDSDDCGPGESEPSRRGRFHRPTRFTARGGAA